MAELVKEFEMEIGSFALIPSDGGRFEVTVNNRLVYSKLRTGRHVEPGEARTLIANILKEGR